jgi:hypothetical protein
MQHRWIVIVSLLSLLTAQLACVQDCIGAAFPVKGYVVDGGGNPIPGATIRVWGDNSFEKPGFDLNVISNEEGAFETDSVFRYGCTPFRVEVSADSYQPYVQDFYPPTGEGWSPELPGELTVMLTRQAGSQASVP